ncbi:aspartate/glutamate racemase family protein [Oceanobacillus locisalsi]|uniref:Aspartate/glutamate racemase family protein n=1 Tax=Oceanobacillus locisalsi TaxID=546107 RepID=A0ABW3NEA6_9BACI
MKLLVINPFATDAYDEKISNVIESVTREDTSIVVEHLDRGLPFIRHAYFQSLIVPDIVERIYQAEKEGFDGVFVSCIFEPGVKEAKELVDIPVIGGSVPNIFLARQLGQRFAFLTDTPRADAITYDLFKQNKLDTECVGIKSVDMGVEDIKKYPEKSQERIIEHIKEFRSQGADVIINGCTVLAAFFEKENIPSELQNIPIIDTNVGSIKTLEMMVDLHQKYNLTVSRDVSYQKPQDLEPSAFEQVRKTYGY